MGLGGGEVAGPSELVSLDPKSLPLLVHPQCGSGQESSGAASHSPKGLLRDSEPSLAGAGRTRGIK